MSGLNNIDSVEIFNEEFVSIFLFKEDALIENSYEVFVKNEEYDRNVFSGLEGKVNNKVIEQVNSIRLKKSKLQEEEQRFVVTLHKEASHLIEKLDALKNLNYFILKGLEIEDLEKTLKSYMVDSSEYPNLLGSEIEILIHDINKDILTVITEISQLKGVIARLKKDLNGIISGKVNDINEFLEMSGFEYIVEIPANDPSYRIILRPKENESIVISNPKNNLSFGERNIFALVLFVHKVLKTQPKLIILDDPVSSFDKNKKFSIMHYLFSRENKLRKKTVFLLTHDYETVLDFIKILPSDYKSNAKYLSNLNGDLKEQNITKEDIYR